jgi:CelD/BcsL family acetyltransferase involved in cellulose biosynthesis
MTMAAATTSRATMQTSAVKSLIADIHVFRTLDAAAAAWIELEGPDGLSTPYQRFAFLSAWQQHVGASQGLEPCIVAGYDAGQRPLFLFPLAAKSEGGFRSARFLGGKHATFNMALWRRDIVGRVTEADLGMILNALRQKSGVDVLSLAQQPQSWLGVRNPMSLLPWQPAVNDCPLMTIVPGSAPDTRISNSFRRRLKGKERKLQALPGYRYVLARSEADVRRLLDAFFIVKPQRMAAQKLPNVFAEPGVEEFIRTACTARIDNGGYAIDIHALVCDSEMIAMYAGVADGHRFSMMFNTYTMSEHAKYSPGQILMRDIIDHYAAEGYTSLDLGIGSDEYKLLFCKDDEPIFDSFIPVTAKGRMAAMALSGLANAKRFVKQNAGLMKVAGAVRSAIHR